MICICLDELDNFSYLVKNFLKITNTQNKQTKWIENDADNQNFNVFFNFQLQIEQKKNLKFIISNIFVLLYFVDSNELSYLGRNCSKEP